MARHTAQSRSSSSRRGTSSTSSRRVSASSSTSEEEKHVVLPAPPSPRCVKRRDFKAQGRARSRAKNLRRMESEESSSGLGGDLNGGAGQVAAIEGGEGGSQELCPDEEKKAADNQVEVTEPPFIMVEAYTVGGGGGGAASPGREQDLSTTSGGHTQVVEETNSVTEEEEVVLRKNEHNEFLSNRANQPTTITKPDSLDFEQEQTSGFWTHRSSIISVTDSARGSSVLEAGSPTESVRDFLMQKRSSLTHTPDVVRVLQKLEAQHAGAGDVHEFQKVKKELKPVDDEGATYLQLEKISQLANFSNINSSREETVTEVDTSTRNVVVNMMPAPIVAFPAAGENASRVGEEEKKVEGKANAGQPKGAAGTAGRKKQSSTTSGAASGLSSKSRKNPGGGGGAAQPQPPKAAKSGEGTLESPNLIQLVKPAGQNGTDKPTSNPGEGSLESPNLLKEVNGVPRRMSNKVAAGKKNPEKRLSSPAQLQGATSSSTRRHVPRPTPPSSKPERRSKSPDKQPTSLPPSSNNALPPEAQKTRKQSNASVTSVKSTHSDQEQRRASFKPTESNVKGGFLAPTKAWLSLRGENVSLNTRSPSPGSKMSVDVSTKERSMSPKRKLRESSAESDSQSRKSVSFGKKERKSSGKDPALPTMPTVRRSSSLRGEAGKRSSRVLKKASMENLATQNGVAATTEAAKTKKDISLTRASKERASLRQSSRSKESNNLSNGEPPSGKRDVSKEKTKLSAVKRSTSLRKDRSKEAGTTGNVENGSNLRKRDASKENGAIKTTSNVALSNGAGENRSNGEQSNAKKDLTSISNGHLVTKNTESSSKEGTNCVLNEKSKTKNGTTETATSKSEATETTISSSSAVSAVSRTSTERRSSENKSSVASMSQMKMVQKAGKSSLSSEKTSSETLQATSTSSSRAVKEISETERSTSNRVNTITNNKAIVSSSTSSLVRAEGSTPNQDLLRTTMVVRFRPGQPNQQGAWLADVQTGGSTTSSICGLEISFSSVPQDIDIKVIPSEDSAGAPPKGGGDSDKQS